MYFIPVIVRLPYQLASAYQTLSYSGHVVDRVLGNFDRARFNRES